jgi:hypothetical protein
MKAVIRQEKSRGVPAPNVAPGKSRRLVPFNQGCDTEHAGEIRLGHDMAVAADLLWGKDRCKRIIRSSPSKLFRKFRYGRWFAPPVGEGNREWFGLALHGGRFIGVNRAKDEHIMRPGDYEWMEFLEQVRRVAQRPRYADGWTATAETLDDMGYAIAESIAVFELYDYAEDDDLIYLLIKHD